MTNRALSQTATKQMAQQDSCALLDCLRGLYAHLDPERLTALVCASRPQIVPTEAPEYKARRRSRGRAAGANQSADTAFIENPRARARRTMLPQHNRMLLDLLRPHLAQAYHNAETVSRMQQALACLQQVMEESNQGMILLTREGQIRWITGQAQRWIEEYFEKLPCPADRLPEALWQWARDQQALGVPGDSGLPPGASLIVEREGKRLIVRLIAKPSHDQTFLRLEEKQAVLSAASLKSLGLSQREAEVLFWVAQGKTNPQVAIILHMCPNTVKKHLERIYKRLNVENRTAAISQVMETLGWGKP
ncbi:MAG: hypothetical protein HYY20_10830 [Candidatus Tectomicrobia bacterium]|uniref:HTH luxR-type domain-containing protein n=1 Tax=Tectimicrobiota bacterium TaxID=2528274 RepID=A0A932FW28_UNCTE|nr:hypothetical protein [Candidatus Tectomicrobia bacterium]